MTRSRLGLLAALGVDNFGSGLFLPVVLLYVPVLGWLAGRLPAAALRPAAAGAGTLDRVA